jgi:WS/DGAT/MGAT family acyltransferase
MSPDDSAFWRMESDVSRMHGVTLVVLRGPVPDPSVLRDHVARCVTFVPRLRQKVVEVPLRLGRPMWIDDPDFDVDNHLVATTTSGMAGVQELVTLIVSRRLDRSMPLWQLTVVTGLEDGRWAIISKVHHSIIDGLYGTEPLATLIDGAVAPEQAVETWAPPPPPGDDELVRRALTELMLDPVEQYRFGRAAFNRSRRRMAELAGQGGRNLPPDPFGLRGPIGHTRAWASATVPLGPLRAVRAQADTSLHQLVMLLVTSGLRAWLRSRDEGRTSWPPVTAVVPMAVADPTAGFAGGISTERIALPVGERDLARRLGRLPQPSASMSQPAPVEAQIGLSGLIAPTLASLGLREVARHGAADGGADVVVLNVPGPSTELTILGRPVVEIDPVMPLVARARVSIGVFSYLGRLAFGVTADRDSIPDVQVIATGIRSAFDELTADLPPTRNEKTATRSTREKETRRADS